MNIKTKETKLRNFAKSVIDYPKYKNEINYLLSKLDLTKDKVVQSYVDYDLDISKYGNEIYESLSMRFVLHLHNLLKESWHQERQKTIMKMIKKLDIKDAVDIGFGVPTKYIRESVLKTRKIKLTLADVYDSAFKFAEQLLNYLDRNWKEIIFFKKVDMNDYEYPGDYDLYLFIDSIEHVKNPSKYLSKIVKESPDNSVFIFSLPIGPKVNTHFIEWKNYKEAEKWLNGHDLKIRVSKKVYVNPKVDLFAEQLDYKFYNLILTAEKIKK